MNVRKNIDYSEMYEELDMLMAKKLPQMELYCEIGKAVCRRTEKGAAVMASEYLNKQYPDVKGFSPRSLRRMRDFYRTYENDPALLSRAMQLGWIQNVVIMEAELTMDLREWYMKAVKQFGWSKTELISNIAENVHEVILLSIDENPQIIEEEKEVVKHVLHNACPFQIIILCINSMARCKWLLKKDYRRRCQILGIFNLASCIFLCNIGKFFRFGCRYKFQRVNIILQILEMHCVFIAKMV